MYNNSKEESVELRKRFDIRKILIFVYFFAFGIYLIIGFMPVEASQNVYAEMSIPEIELSSEVLDVQLSNNKLDTPDYSVGRYSISENNDFLFGHSSSVFSRLHDLSLNDLIYYQNTEYRIVKIDLVPKSMISMTKLLEEKDTKTITIMTCAGEYYDAGDASHRLILTAIAN